MTCADFRRALSNLHFIDLPKSIDGTKYGADLTQAWNRNPEATFFRLSNADQEKVWAVITKETVG
jgi:hypothetical protein